MGTPLKWSDADKATILQRYKSGVPLVEIGREFSVESRRIKYLLEAMIGEGPIIERKVRKPTPPEPRKRVMAYYGRQINALDIWRIVKSGATSVKQFREAITNHVGALGFPPPSEPTLIDWIDRAAIEKALMPIERTSVGSIRRLVARDIEPSSYGNGEYPLEYCMPIMSLFGMIPQHPLPPVVERAFV